MGVPRLCRQGGLFLFLILFSLQQPVERHVLRNNPASTETTRELWHVDLPPAVCGNAVAPKERVFPQTRGIMR